MEHHTHEPELRATVSDDLSPAYLARARVGKAKWGILMWLLGVPIPIILLIFLVRGCA